MKLCLANFRCGAGLLIATDDASPKAIEQNCVVAAVQMGSLFEFEHVRGRKERERERGKVRVNRN